MAYGRDNKILGNDAVVRAKNRKIYKAIKDKKRRANIARFGLKKFEWI
jgi:hypothetical protein